MQIYEKKLSKRGLKQDLNPLKYKLREHLVIGIVF